MRNRQLSRSKNLQKKSHSCQARLFAFPNHIKRLGLYAGLCIAFTSGCTDRSSQPSQTEMLQSRAPEPTIAWAEAKPEAVGLDSVALKEAEQVYPRLFPSGYSLLVIRNGYLVSESYFHGQTAETSNHIWSVTKTFAATLLGVAVQQGWVDDVHQRVADLLPENAIHPGLEALTLEDVLTHRSGVRSDNRFADIDLLLQGEPKAPPGATYEYSNYAPNLLTAILDRIAKQGKAGAVSDVPSLAQEYLFGPLGINVTEWRVGPHGVPEGANGLHMTARDLARLGYLLLREGRWEDEQLLPPDWVEAASEHRVGVDRQKGYGYLNWVRRRPDAVLTADGKQSVHGYFAYGHRGQLVAMYPELDLLVVTMADATDPTRDTFFVPDLLHDFVRRFVFSSIIKPEIASPEK